MTTPETPLDSGTVLRRSADVLEAEIDGEVVMMSGEKGEYYGLDKIGSEIWALLAEPSSVEDVCARLLPQYDVDEEQGRRDILVFLEALVSDGSVVVVG